MKYQKAVLQNGLVVIGIPKKEALSVAIDIFVRSGSRYENKDEKGLAHFLEHMAFKGSTKFPSAQKIAHFVEGLGGAINAYTGKEEICYWVHLPAYNFKQGAELLSDIIFHPLFEEGEIEKEKGVVLEEYNRNLDFPDSFGFGEFLKIVFPNHPLGWNILGEKETIEKISREKLLKYTARLFSPSNMVVAIGGGGNFKEWVKTIDQFLGKKKNYQTPFSLPFKDTQQKPHLSLVFKETDQSHLFLGFKTFGRTEDIKKRIILKVLNVILGGSFGSRLVLTIRDELGIAYAIGSSIMELREIGLWECYGGFTLQKTDLAVKTILEEIQKIKERGVSLKELKRAKEFIGGRLILSTEQSYSLASFYGEQAALDPYIYSVEEILKMIKEVSLKEIQTVAKEVFRPEKLNLTILGPFKEKEKPIFEKILKSYS